MKVIKQKLEDGKIRIILIKNNIKNRNSIEVEKSNVND